MTWTCDRPECPNINHDDSQVCLSCGEKREDDRPAGLSEEERAGFDALVAAQAACGEELWSLEEFVKDTEVRKIVVAFTRAARAAFERETAKDKANINDLLSTCTRHSRERVQYKARIAELEAKVAGLTNRIIDIGNGLLRVDPNHVARPCSPDVAAVQVVAEKVVTIDRLRVEVERLKGELARAKEFQATVRDADRRLRFTCEANVPPPRRFYETVMAAMAKLEPAPAQPERKVQSQPQDEVFCGKCPEVVPASTARGLKECRIHGEILNSERTDAPQTVQTMPRALPRGEGGGVMDAQLELRTGQLPWAHDQAALAYIPCFYRAANRQGGTVAPPEKIAERGEEIIEEMKEAMNVAGPGVLSQWQRFEHVDHPFCFAIYYLAMAVARAEFKGR